MSKDCCVKNVYVTQSKNNRRKKTFIRKYIYKPVVLLKGNFILTSGVIVNF